MKPLLPAALGIACIAVVSYVVWTERNEFSTAVSGELVFPGLLDELNSVVDISIQSEQGRFQIAKIGKFWTVPGRHGYMADFDKVRKTLVGLAQIRKIDAATSNPEQYRALGVDDVTAPDSRSVMISVAGGSGVLAELIVGRKRGPAAIASLYEFYVRMPGKRQSWIVEGLLPEIEDEGAWLDRRIASIDSARIQETLIETPDSASIRVFRESMQSDDFGLDQIPSGKKIRFQFQLNDIGKVLDRLNFEEFMPAGDWNSGIKFKSRTFDGLVIEGALSADDSQYAVFRASFDEVANESVQSEAARLTRKWQGWAYRLPDSRLGTLSLGLDDLVDNANGKQK